MTTRARARLGIDRAFLIAGASLLLCCAETHDCNGASGACDAGPSSDGALGDEGSDGGSTGADASDGSRPGTCATRLCGGGHCSVLVDEMAYPRASSNNETASLVLDATGTPVMLVEDANMGFRGFVVRRRAPADWQVTRVPSDVAMGSIALGAAGPTTFATMDGSRLDVTTLYQDVGGTLTNIATVPVQTGIRSSRLWRDAAGTLHMVAGGGISGTGDSGPLYVRYDGSFHPTPLGTPGAFAQEGTITLADDGTAWVSWIESVPSPGMGDAVLVWRSDTAATSTITTTTGGARAGNAGAIGLAVRSTAMGPELIALVTDSWTAPLAIVVGAPDGSWTRTDLIDAHGPHACPVDCTVDPASAALVRLGDDLLVLFAANFRDPADSSLRSILFTMPITGPLDEADVVLDRSAWYADSLRAVVDTCGVIHVAQELSQTSSYDDVVRYIQLGAP